MQSHGFANKIPLKCAKRPARKPSSRRLHPTCSFKVTEQIHVFRREYHLNDAAIDQSSDMSRTKYVCINVCMCVCMYVCIFVCMYVRMYICIYVCMRLCMYM